MESYQNFLIEKIFKISKPQISIQQPIFDLSFNFFFYFLGKDLYQIYVKKNQKEDEIFNDVPKKSIVWESHNDEVTKIPKDFIILANSESCKIQAMKFKKRGFYGLQFHPEVEHTEYGEQIFKNFVKMCKK